MYRFLRVSRVRLYTLPRISPLETSVTLLSSRIKTDKSNNSICYFIGFNIDSKQFIGKSDKNIYIDDCTSKFQ